MVWMDTAAKRSTFYLFFELCSYDFLYELLLVTNKLQPRIRYSTMNNAFARTKKHYYSSAMVYSFTQFLQVTQYNKTCDVVYG